MVRSDFASKAQVGLKASHLAAKTVRKSQQSIAARVTPNTTQKSRRRVVHTGCASQTKLGASLGESPTASLAAAHLQAVDSRFAPLVKQHGLIDKIPDNQDATAKGAFSQLLKTIVYQQLAGKAAATIHGRVLDAVGVKPPTPEAVLATEYAHLRAAGLSDRKASYIVDLASHFSDGRLSEELLAAASDDELLSSLTAVKGIGVWSCQMFMLFTLGRPDVLPTGDLGVQKGFAKFFGIGSKLPKPAEMEALAESWRPYRSFGTAYMWRCQDQT